MSVIDKPRKAETRNAPGIAKLWWLRVKHSPSENVASVNASILRAPYASLWHLPVAAMKRAASCWTSRPQSLDLAHQASVLTSIRAQARLGTAVVTVFHDLNLAAALADDIVLLAGGQIKAVGAPANILKDDLLSAAYGCKVLTNRTPSDGRPFVLPPAVFSMLDIVR